MWPEPPCAGAGDEQPSTCKAKKASKKAAGTGAEELPQAEMTFLWQLLKLSLKREASPAELVEWKPLPVLVFNSQRFREPWGLSTPN